MTRNTPCKGCQRREVGCHAKCPDYAEYHAMNEETRKRRYEEMELYDVREGIRKIIKYKTRTRQWRKG